MAKRTHGKSTTVEVYNAADWTVVGDSSANAALQVSKAAVANKQHFVTAFEVVISAADATGDIEITLEQGTTVKWKTFLGDSAVRGDRVGVVFTHPLEFDTNTAVNLEVAAGGASCVTTGSIAGYTQ